MGELAKHNRRDILKTLLFSGLSLTGLASCNRSIELSEAERQRLDKENIDFAKSKFANASFISVQGGFGLDSLEHCLWAMKIVNSEDLRAANKCGLYTFAMLRQGSLIPEYQPVSEKVNNGDMVFVVNVEPSEATQFNEGMRAAVRIFKENPGDQDVLKLKEAITTAFSQKFPAPES